MATVNLTWANTSTGGTRTGFRLWRLKDTSGAPADAAAVIASGTEMTSITSTLASSAVAATDTTADTSSTYYYVLKATNGAGDSGPALSGSSAEFATVVIA